MICHYSTFSFNYARLVVFYIFRMLREIVTILLRSLITKFSNVDCLHAMCLKSHRYLYDTLGSNIMLFHVYSLHFRGVTVCTYFTASNQSIRKLMELKWSGVVCSLAI